MTSPQNPNLAPNLPPQGPRRVVYLEANRPPTIADTKYRDGSFYEFNTEWRDKSVDPPNIYKLSNIVSKTHAIWVLDTGGQGVVIQFTPSSGSIVYPTSDGNVNVFGSDAITVTGTTNTLTIDSAVGIPFSKIAVQATTAPGVSPVLPTSTGLVTINGAVVANHSVVLETRSRALNALNLEVQYATNAAATDGTKAGVSVFSSAQFDVDAAGYVTLKGSVNPSITGVNVDAHTAPGTDPVLADASGNITITGGQVAAGTVGANAIRTDSLAANTFTIEIQRADEAATSSVNNAGICSFDSANFTVDSNGWVQLTGGSNVQAVSNLGIAYSGGTFTVCSASGAALSASNPGIVWLQDKSTPGQLKKYLVTANQTFTDGTAGQTATANFGITTTRYDGSATSAWSEDMPMYLYAVGNDSQDTIAFMISRNPAAVNSPAAASISKQGAIINVDRYDFYCLPDVTVADYESNPCINVGAFRVRTTINASNNNITVQTLSTKDGIGNFHESTTFLMPAGVNGSGSGNYFQNNGGTLGPTFNSSNVQYTLKKSGFLVFNFEMNGVSANGTGANVLKATLPYKCASSYGTDSIFTYYNNGGTAVVTYYTGTQNSSDNYIFQFGLAGSAAKMNQNGFTANDEFGFRTSYQAFAG